MKRGYLSPLVTRDMMANMLTCRDCWLLSYSGTRFSYGGFSRGRAAAKGGFSEVEEGGDGLSGGTEWGCTSIQGCRSVISSQRTTPKLETGCHRQHSLGRQVATACRNGARIADTAHVRQQERSHNSLELDVLLADHLRKGRTAAVISAHE